MIRAKRPRRYEKSRDQFCSQEEKEKTNQKESTPTTHNTKSVQHPRFPSGHPPQYSAGLTWLNFAKERERDREKDRACETQGELKQKTLRERERERERETERIRERQREREFHVVWPYTRV